VSAPLSGRVLIARLGDERIALAVEAVVEVLDAPDVAPLPLTPPGIAGQLAHGAGFLPMLDPAVLLGVARAGGAGAALVLARVGAALWVDDVEDVWLVSPEDLHEVPRGVDARGVLRAILRREGLVVALLDPGVLAAVAAATLRQEQMQ
jgi:chemotaxis signal transduction protein